MSLKYLLCTHGNIVEAIYEKNNMVLYSTMVFSGLPLVMCIMQGESPKSLAVRFEKSACIEYMNVAEKDCKLPEFYQGMLTFKSFKTYFKKYLLDDEYPAHLAAYNGNLQLLSMLISEGHCHINQSDPLGCSPAHKGHQHEFCIV